MDIHINIETVIQIALAIVAASIVVTKFIDALQARGKIGKGQAGEWNQAVAFFVALATFVIKWFGFDEGIPQAEQLGMELSLILVSGFTVAIVSKLIHYVVKWLEGQKRHDSPPLAQTPVG